MNLIIGGGSPPPSKFKVMRKKLNTIVILLIGFGMPIYYKVKFILLGLIGFEDIWNWTFPLEIGFSILLASFILFSHDMLASFLTMKLDKNRNRSFRFIIQYLASTAVAVLAAIVFSVGFWNYIMRMPITAEFIFDYAMLGLIIPLLVNGISESLFFYGLWEKTNIEKEQLEKENLKAQYEVLQSQISPHFLFNCFNTLNVLIQESKQAASDFLQHLSKVYRYVIELNREEMVKIESELDALDTYLELMKYRFGKNIQLNVDVAKAAYNKFMAPFTLQMLMENALKHNQFSEKQPLKVTIDSTDKWLTFKNTVNHFPNADGTGTGLRNLNERYSLLTGKEIQINENDQNFEVMIPLTEISLV